MSTAPPPLSGPWVTGGTIINRGELFMSAANDLQTQRAVPDPDQGVRGVTGFSSKDQAIAALLSLAPLRLGNGPAWVTQIVDGCDRIVHVAADPSRMTASGQRLSGVPYGRGSIAADPVELDAGDDVNASESFPLLQWGFDIRASSSTPLLSTDGIEIGKLWIADSDTDPGKGEALQLFSRLIAYELDRERRVAAVHGVEIARYQAVVESASDAIVTSDAAGLIVTWNSAAERMFGWTATEAIGQPAAIVVPERFRDAHLSGMARLAAGGVPKLFGQTLDLWGVRRAGDEFTLQLSLSTWESQDRPFYSAILRDTTQRTQAEEALRQAKEAAEQASRLKSQFLANVSHELRTPLTSVNGYVDLLLDGEAGPIVALQEEFLRTIKRNADRQLGLITGLLDFARIEAGQLKLTLTDVDLNTVGADVIEQLVPQAASKDIGLEMVFPDDLPDARGDRERVFQVLLNLVGNAVKFTDTGGVVVSAQVGRNQVTVLVTDTGVGISAEDLPHVFDEFRQADGSETRRFGGTGLGLAIAKRLTELQGGSLTVESRLGVGSVFSLSLPLAAAPASVLPEDAGATRSARP